MHTVKLTVATEKDLELILAWRSQPAIYKYFRVQKSPLTWQEHTTFWKKRKHRIDFIIEHKEKTWRKVGTVNISQLDAAFPPIGILVGELTLQGKGIGSQALELAMVWLKRKGYKGASAEVHTSNLASQRLFKKNGFKKVEQSSRWGQYHCIFDKKKRGKI